MSATIATSVPASYVVEVIGQSLSGGGSALDLIGLMLSKSNRVPNNTVLAFPSASSVGSYFGLTAPEYADAQVYFGGFTTSTAKPAAMLIANYPTANVGAFLRGGIVSSLTLLELQAITGVLTVTIDGTPHTSSAINLSTATSFSNAAQLINNGLALTGPTQASVTASIGAVFTGNSSGTNLTTTSTVGVIHIGDVITGTGVSGSVSIASQTSGTTGGNGVYVTSASTTCSSATVTATSTVLDVTAVASGVILAGGAVGGAGVTSGTYINTFGVTVGGVATTGTGGIGTYSITVSQEIASETMTVTTPVVTYDSIAGAFTVISSTTGSSSTISYGSGTLAVPAVASVSSPGGLSLTQASGAVTSQGAVTAVPNTYMVNLVNITTNWATFWPNFDPDGGSGNANKQLFAAWVTTTDNRYVYIADDQDTSPTTSPQPATTSLGYILQQNGNSGTVVNYQPGPFHLAAFVAGSIASINFAQQGGRSTLAFKGQAGLTVGVTSEQVLTDLVANDYNAYVQFATANTLFQNYYPGQITGAFQWIDSYVNQIWLTNQLQLALMELLNNTPSIPYNSKGYGLIYSACLDPINAAVNFGAITVGVPPSNAQAAIVNAAAGLSIAAYLQNNGYYLQVLPATAQNRAARATPPINLWYMDGESVQSLNLSAIDVQ